ncbi:hypothetical protein [Flavobacterium terrisoli]|uniref:hypothetical protein n=1 Tax=Flavobacterium terrisoli TaxID=3242195 RepID=UPI002543E1B1|nr:hypothetical protein [Flavobacterium buctense]
MAGSDFPQPENRQPEILISLQLYINITATAASRGTLYAMPHMKHLKIIIALIFALNCNSIYAHKDRIERPKIYVLYFAKERIEIKNSEKVKLEKYGELIATKKKKLTNADLVFETGEVVSFEFVNYKCQKIEIEYMKRSLFVPKNKVEKITGINLLSVNLLWSGDKPQAFNSEYFYIQFSTGKTEFPYFQFFFEKNKFSESYIWIGNENSSKAKKI